jgi:hypothetical protein
MKDSGRMAGNTGMVEKFIRTDLIIRDYGKMEINMVKERSLIRMAQLANNE